MSWTLWRLAMLAIALHQLQQVVAVVNEDNNLITEQHMDYNDDGDGIDEHNGNTDYVLIDNNALQEEEEDEEPSINEINDNKIDTAKRIPNINVYRRGCIHRAGRCDHHPNNCCFNSSCRCNLWGTNCRCQRIGLFQKWG